MQKKKYKEPLLLKFVRWFFPRLERLAPALAHRYFRTVFFTPLHHRTPEKEKIALKYAKSFQVEVAGKRVAGYEWGDRGRYVLLVHGWAGRATQMRRFIKPLLRAGFRVIGFDGPAHGTSGGKRTSIIEFETALKKIVEKFGPPEAVIAHSFGGSATLFAAMNGLPVRKVINIASPSLGDDVIRTFLSAVNGSWATGEAFKAYIKKTTGRTFEEFSALYFVQHLPSPVNLLLIHDENDKDVPIRHAEAVISVYPYANLIRTRKLGHRRILRDDEVIRRCVTFIRDSTSEIIHNRQI